MGRWMEVVREQPPEGERYAGEMYDKLIVAEAAPHPLVEAFACLCEANPGARKAVQQEFPMFEKVGLHSPEYVDEDLWLASEETERLLAELQRLRRICRYEEFVRGLDGAAVYRQWSELYSTEEFDQWLDHLERLLGEAISSRHWVRLML